MTPFQQFRVWVRRAPTADRISATLAAVVVLGLLGWLVAPVHHHTASDDQVSVGAAGTGATPSTSAPPTPGAAVTTPAGASGAVAPSTPGAAQATSAAASTGAGSGCAAPPGADQGVTATQIKVAISLVNIVGPAGNSTFGVPSTTEQQADFQQVIDAVNAGGGVACRKLVPQFFEANPVNSSDLQQKCLDIVQAKPFFVIDTGGFYGSPTTNCFPQHQLPFLGNGRLTASQRDQVYPYLFGQGSVETLYRNAVFALRDRGFFGAANGFQKLGYFYRSCFPEITKGFLGWGTDLVPKSLDYIPDKAVNAGVLPAAGGWHTLEIPLEQIGAAGKLIDGVGFMHDGGRIFWQGTALVLPDDTQHDLWRYAIGNPTLEPGTAKIHADGLKAGEMTRI